MIHWRATDQLDIDQRWLDCFVLSGPELKHALRELLDSTEAKRDCVYKARLAVVRLLPRAQALQDANVSLQVTHPHYVSMCRRRRSGYPTTQQVLTHGTHHKA